MRERLDLYYYFKVLNKWKWKIGIVVVIAVCISAVISVRQPRLYRASTTFIIAEEKESTSFSFSVAGSPVLKTRSSSFPVVIGLLRSRHMAEDIIKRFDLLHRYNLKSMDEAVKKVNDMLDPIRIEGHTVISLRVVTEDPELSRDIANFVISNLDEINKELGISPDRPFVKVIDFAIAPSTVVDRNIAVKVAASGLLACLVTVILVFIIEYREKMDG